MRGSEILRIRRRLARPLVGPDSREQRWGAHHGLTVGIVAVAVVGMPFKSVGRLVPLPHAPPRWASSARWPAEATRRWPISQETRSPHGNGKALAVARDQDHPRPASRDLAQKWSLPANQRTVRIASDASPPRGALFKRGAAGSALSRRALTLLVNRRLPSVVDVEARRAGRTSWRRP